MRLQFENRLRLNMVASVIFGLVVISYIIIYILSTSNFDYWKKKKIPYLKPVPFFGNYGPYICLQRNIGLVLQSLCRKFPNAPYFGVFYGTKPCLVVKDPEMIKLVMTKHFYYFSGREISEYTHNELFTQNMFFTYGDRWKLLRQNLNPLFSILKMRNMFYLIEKCSHEFEDLLDYECSRNNIQHIRLLMARYTMDCIGSCAFGMDFRTMAKDDTTNPFTRIGKLIFAESYLNGLKLVARSIWPELFYGVGMKTFTTEADKLFESVMLKIFKARDYKPTMRNDFVDSILSFKNNKYISGDSIHSLIGENKKVSLEINDGFLVGQCSTFFAAAYDTSATTLQYTFYELAKNQDAQERVHQEVDEFLKKHNNKLVYDCVTELPYSEACVDEALRMYPVLTHLTREVFERYTLPCGTVLDKGMRIHLPVYYLQHNPDYFPEPEVFRPERFLGEEKRKIKPYTYLPFGEGPRICIGIRFAKMMILAGFVTVMKKYRLELAGNTPLNLKLKATALITQPRETVKLRFVEREGWEQRVFK